MKLFRDGKPFYKGNIHCHSTRSDGRISPEEVMAVYYDMGYDFLALTDHRKVSKSGHSRKNMLLLSGVEWDYALPAEVIHLVGIGMDAGYTPKASLQDVQSEIRRIRKHHGCAVLAHPAWSLNTLATLSALQGVTAAEIYNSGSTLPWEADRADSSILLDIAATHGAPYGIVAADDSHSYTGEAGRGFIMVQSDELTQVSIIAALDAGWFYASQGPTFEQITIENDHIHVRCSPVDSVVFYSNRVWSHGRCITKPGQTEASYDLTANEGETFIRCQIVDANGRSAWANPIILPLS